MREYIPKMTTVKMEIRNDHLISGRVVKRSCVFAVDCFEEDLLLFLERGEDLRRESALENIQKSF